MVVSAHITTHHRIPYQIQMHMHIQTLTKAVRTRARPPSQPVNYASMWDDDKTMIRHANNDMNIDMQIDIVVHIDYSYSYS